VEFLKHFFSIPLIPSAVTPWLTAFNAYSVSGELAFGRTGLDGEARALSGTAILNCTNLFGPASHYRYISIEHVKYSDRSRCAWWQAGVERSYLGENVVKEKEYLSAMISVRFEIYSGLIPKADRGREGLMEITRFGEGWETELLSFVGVVDQATLQAAQGREFMPYFY
jgi:hypothetical protein